MSKQEAIESLKEEQGPNDPESAHLTADRILCEFLSSLGHSDVVAEFEKIRKWYA